MKIEKEYVLREIAGDYIIIPVGESAQENNGLITINEAGMFLWNRMKEECTEDQLIQDMLEEYEVDEETARQDVQEFIECMKYYKIL